MKKLSEQIYHVIKEADGEWGVVVRKIGAAVPICQLNQDERFYAASVNKVAIALYVLNQVSKDEVKLHDRLVLTADLKLPGTGILKYLDDDLMLTMKDIVTLMLITSDNTAAKTLVNHFGVDNINLFLDNMGLLVTRLEKMPENKFSYGYTTAGEYAQILQKIVDSNCLTPELSILLLEIMAHNFFNLGLKRSYSAGNSANEDSLKVSSKEGTLDDMRHEVALICKNEEKFIISVFSKNLADQSYSVDNAGVLVLSKIGEAIRESLRGSEN